MQIIEFISYSILPVFLLLILFGCLAKKISAYDTFTSGVSESLSTILKIFPTMLAVVVAVNLFKTSGAMNLFVSFLEPIFSAFNIPSDVVPLGIMRSISGGGSLALLSDLLKTHGPDSLVGKIASTIMGSSDTTLYVIAMYTAACRNFGHKKSPINRTSMRSNCFFSYNLSLLITPQLGISRAQIFIIMYINWN